MNKVCTDVLNRIYKASPEGRYVIISEDDFYDIFDGSDSVSDDLEKALSTLKTNGYIDVKYARGDMYCVAPKKEYSEGKTEKNETTKVKPDKIFIYAFLGGGLGSMLVSLIFALF
jgi:hypothetical protein